MSILVCVFRFESVFGLDQDYAGVFEQDVYLSSVPKSAESPQEIYSRLEEHFENKINISDGLLLREENMMFVEDAKKLLRDTKKELLEPFEARAGDGYRMSEYLDEKFKPFLTSRAEPVQCAKNTFPRRSVP